jgi:2-polyprenyl-3-methyl-5-hydroxy-6-metoxy-1,4-benzoquinol methylase
MHLRRRSNEKEYLDGDDIATTDLCLNLSELDVINRYLGGYKASLNGLKEILRSNKKINTILDIGFGGGDSIKQFAIYSAKNNLDHFYYGVDLKRDCISYAEKNLSPLKNKELICDDFRNISTDLLSKIDIIHSSLFLHHLSNDEIIGLLKFAKSNNCTFLANDLHRHWLAYYSIKFLTALFSKSYLVKNDAPISVKRGFKKAEIESLLKQSGFTDFSVKWSWAFRYIIIARS